MEIFSILGPYFASFFLCCFIALYCFYHARQRIVRVFGMMALVEGFWAIFFVLEILSADLSVKMAFDGTQSIFMFLSAVFCLDFSIEYNLGTPKGLGRRGYVYFLAFPVLYIVFSMTPEGASLVYLDPRVTPAPYGTQLWYEYGFLSWLGFIYTFLLFSTALVLFVKRLLNKKDRLRASRFIIFFGYFIPVVLIGIPFLLPTGFFPYRDISPIAFGLGKIILIVPILMKVDVFDYRSLMKDLIMKEIPNPVFVLSPELKIIDTNFSADEILSYLTHDERLFFEHKIVKVLNESKNSLDLNFLDGEERNYTTKVKTVYTANRLEAYVLFLHDVSSLKLSEKLLKNTLNTMEETVLRRTKDLRAEIDLRLQAEAELVNLNEELKDTQKEILLILSEIVENRSKETANHVIRVAQYSYLLALRYGLDANHASRIRDAAPLHDVGKVAVPDYILNKPEDLNPEEWAIMKEHTRIGKEILSRSHAALLQAASLIAYEHHEKWDGSGYPEGKAGEGISIEGRIVAAADVFDALLSRRVYKEGWSLQEIVDYFIRESGRHFEPRISDLVVACQGDFLLLREKFPDKEPSPERSHYR